MLQGIGKQGSSRIGCETLTRTVILAGILGFSIGPCTAIERGHLVPEPWVARSGVVMVRPALNGVPMENCTGTIVASSQRRNIAWILTAAHCFFEIENISRPEKPDISPLSFSHVQIYDGPTAANLIEEVSAQRVHVYPGFRCSEYPCDDVWYTHKKLDIALVSIPAAGLRIEGPRGFLIDEYVRPVFCGRLADYSVPLVDVLRRVMIMARGAHTCPSEFSVDGCRFDGRLRFIRGKKLTLNPGSATGFLEIDGSDLPNQALLRPADSGAPWLFLPPGRMTRRARIDYTLTDGVVIGVFSAWNADGGWDNWPPVDWVASSVSGPLGSNYIRNATDGAAMCVDTLPWDREAKWPWPWTWWEKGSTQGERAATIAAATLSLH